ncbi:MAG: response regulator [Deltaproteobacteria bacterium]|nr:response regulator [Deltaproteobacteria bacterium]
MTEKDNKGIVLVVDDDPYVLNATSALLNSKGYFTVACQDPREAVIKLLEGNKDIVLTDIKMPNISGIELLKKVHGIYPDMPVVMMTAYADLEIAIEAIRNGAFDLIIKPYNSEYLLFTIEKAVRYKALVEMEKNYKKVLEDTVKTRTEELANAMKALKESSLETIKRLAVVAEYRDTDTGHHISRIGFYTKVISEALQMPSIFVETIGVTSMMHDIGKIGIPDRILLKPGPLSKDEDKIMKTHTTIGHDMLSGSIHYSLLMAATIAINHHERWDGSGYPKGLKGEDIPMEGRITMICDVYDSLRSKRPYKPALGHKEAVSIITEGDGRTLPGHFCPKVFKAFKENASAFDEIYNEHIEEEIR